MQNKKKICRILLQNKNKNKKKETTCQMSFIHYTCGLYVFFLILNVLEGVCFFMLFFNKHNLIIYPVYTLWGI